MRPITATIFLCLGLPPGAARALTPGEHWQVTRHACQTATMPAVFCERVATAAHDVDALAPDDPAAHAERADGQPVCQAAAAAEARAWSLGSRIREQVERLARARAPSVMADLADRLGQVLHLLQDACVHAGSTAAEEAARLLSLACADPATAAEPEPLAATCAARVTRTTFQELGALLDRNGLSGTVFFEVEASGARWSERDAICARLRSAGPRDPEHRHRDPDWMVPRLRDHLVRALRGGPASPGVFCLPAPLPSNPPDAVAPAGTAWCEAVERYCTGTDDGPPPWEQAPVTGEGGGCTTGHGPGGAWVLLVGLALALALGRARARAGFARRRAPARLLPPTRPSTS